jgi:hypothetical protein
MTERRYNEDEVASIFERASEVQRRALPAARPGEGLTLPALQDIGREVGIPPELVAGAARSLSLTSRPAARRFLGLPIGVGRTVDLERPLTEEEWHRLVVDLRETFDARGRVSGEGPFKQWTNGNLEALLEPTPDGQRLRLRTLKSSAMGMMSVGLILLGIGGAVAAGAVLGGDFAARLPGLATLFAMGSGFVAVNAIRLPAWARLRRRQMHEVAERLALATASDAGELGRTP